MGRVFYTAPQQLESPPACQFVKHIGAHVITTHQRGEPGFICAASAADEVVDYSAADFTKLVSGCDAVFDTVAGELAQKTVRSVTVGTCGDFAVVE